MCSTLRRTKRSNVLDLVFNLIRTERRVIERNLGPVDFGQVDPRARLSRVTPDNYNYTEFLIRAERRSDLLFLFTGCSVIISFHD